MTNYSGAYSGRPAYSLRVDITINLQDIALNRTKFNNRTYIRHDSSTTNNSWASTARAWGTSITGWSTGGNAPFMMGPTGDFVGKEIDLFNGVTDWVTHASDGTLTLAVSAFHNMSPDVQGNASVTGSYVVTPIPRNRVSVGVGGVWKTSEVQVGINGVWTIAVPSVGVAGEWKQVVP